LLTLLWSRPSPPTPQLHTVTRRDSLALEYLFVGYPLAVMTAGQELGRCCDK